MSENHEAAAGAAVREAGNPGQLVSDSVEACLEIAATWHAWDGRPVARTVDGKPNTWTPAKALRRITDHLIDHLQQVEALLAWGSTPPSGDTPDPDGPGTPRGPAASPPFTAPGRPAGPHRASWPGCHRSPMPGTAGS